MPLLPTAEDGAPRPGVATGTGWTAATPAAPLIVPPV